MAKRPTTPQIRARAVKILKYQLTTNKTDAQVAKDLGIKRKTLSTLKSGNFKKVRRSYNRSKDYQKAYESAGAVTGKGSRRLNDVRLIQPAYTRKARRAARIREITISQRDAINRAGTYVERYYVSPENAAEYKEYTQRYEWDSFTSDYQTESGVSVPASIRDIRELHDEGLLTDEEFDELETEWRIYYGVGAE